MGKLTGLLSVSDVAKRLEVPERTVSDWCKSGLLAATKFGRAYLIDAASLKKFKRPPRGNPLLRKAKPKRKAKAKR